MKKISPRNLVSDGAKYYSNANAVRFGEQTLSYNQLAAKTSTLSKVLRQQGISEGIQVAMLLPNSLAYIIWYFAVLEAGAIIIPLSPTLKASEIKEFLESSGAGLIVLPENSPHNTEDEFIQERITSSEEGAILWRVANSVTHSQKMLTSGQDIVTRQFSSGSTGRPKHMLKTSANMAHDYWHFCTTHALEQGERFLGVAPFHHSYGAMSFLAAFYLGGCVTIIPRFLPAPVLAAAQQDYSTVFLTTPPMIELLASCFLERGEENIFKNLKKCICSTGRLSAQAHLAFQERFGAYVRVQYGSTETLSATIDLGNQYEEGLVGQPYSEVEIAIFDENENICSIEGEIGLIGIRSPAATTEYLHDSANSAKTFRHGYVFPGDKGYLDNSGVLHVLGRSDIINIGGYKVDRLEVETVIRESLPVKEVIVIEGEQGGLPVVHAIIEADPDIVSRAMIIEACRKRLSDYKIPKLVTISAKLPRDANGKILKSDITPS